MKDTGTKILKVLKTIDTSKMERKFVDFHEMCEKQFEIYEFFIPELDSLTQSTTMKLEQWNA